MYAHSTNNSAWQNRQPWQRSHSHPAHLQTPKPKSLLPISDVTKSKLNKFQYQPRQDADTGSGSPSKRSRGDSTTTPPTRLNWRDLVEPSAPIEEETADLSPNDKIMWNNKQDSLYASALSPMLARKRKRARSSSPTSSPNSPAVNVAKLTKALRSPHADPTLELWDRYSLNGPENEISPTGAMNPTLAQLMMSSSPKTSKDASARRGDSNLRRAVSCGLNWPKRRKVERSKLGSQGSGERRDMEAVSKSSLVTALLDTVTSSFNDEYPDDTRDQDTDSPSPKKRRLCPINTDTPCRASGGDVGSPASDYGDDDFDDDTFMELEANMNDVNPGNIPTTVNPGTPRQGPSETKKEQPVTADEFEDLDDGIFDDAEGFPSNPQPTGSKNITAATTPKAQRTKSIIQGSPGDEFGGDFDGDIDFDAVELAATQSVQKHDAPPGTVCGNATRLSQCSIY